VEEVPAPGSSGERCHKEKKKNARAQNDMKEIFVRGGRLSTLGSDDRERGPVNRELKWRGIDASKERTAFTKAVQKNLRREVLD